MMYEKKRNYILAGIIFLAGILVGGKVLVDNNIITSSSKLYKVAEVRDGDTLILQGGPLSSSKYSQWVRLIGINAPEQDACYYNEAKQVLEKLVLNKKIRLEKDISGLDKFGRLLRYVIVPSQDDEQDDILVNEYLVRHGYALTETYPPDTHYRKLFYNAQDDAQENNRGLWAECDVTKLDYDIELNIDPFDEKCIIKGNVARREHKKIYSLPGCPNYASTKIDPRNGDTYFCTEQEAIEVGFSKAENCP